MFGFSNLTTMVDTEIAIRRMMAMHRAWYIQQQKRGLWFWTEVGASKRTENR